MNSGDIQCKNQTRVLIDVDRWGVPPKPSIFHWIVHYKPSILGTPIHGNLQMSRVETLQFNPRKIEAKQQLLIAPARHSSRALGGPSPVGIDRSRKPMMGYEI